MIELEDFTQAISYFQRAQIIGAPRWLPLLIARLQTQTGKSFLAEKTLENYIENIQDDPELKERAQIKLDNLRKSHLGH